MKQKLAWVCFFLSLFIIRPALAADPQPQANPFNPKPWLEDLAKVHEILATKYANFEWAVFEREADLPKLFSETQSRIEKATNDWEARAAFERFSRKLGDGHVVFDWPRTGHPLTPSASGGSCESLGYNPAMRAAPLAGNAPGYVPLSNAQSDEFPAGVIFSGGQRVGVLQIGVFSEHGFPALCDAAMQALSIATDKLCDDACEDRINSWASDRLTLDLRAQIRALKEARTTVLLIDIAGNGGGSEWAEAVARMLTPIRLRSEDLKFVRGEHWAKTFADDEASLRQFAEHESGSDKAMLLKLADEMEVKRHVALTPCDASALWRGEHPQCEWLGNGFYGSGILAAADPNHLRGKPWAAVLFSPMEFPYVEGVWDGPLIVLIDRNVGSAASEFTAVLQDNHAAIILGEPAGGGCGHTNGGTPSTLENSKATLEVPDCARFRADGSNEMEGIFPDVPVAFAATDGAHLRAKRFIAKLPEAVGMATALHRNRLTGPAAGHAHD